MDYAKAKEIVSAISDEYSQRIVLETMSKDLTIPKMCSELEIPISTCYRKVHRLLRCGIVRPLRTVIDDSGKKFVSYTASFKRVSIRFESGEVLVDATLNNIPNAVGIAASANDQGLGQLLPRSALTVKELVAT